MSAITASSESDVKTSFTEGGLVTISHALTHWYPATFYLLLPLIGSELGLSYGQIGSILTIQYAAGAMSNVPGGILVDTVGRKGILMTLSLFWVGLPYLVMGFSYQYWMLLTCAALVGIGNNLWHPIAIPWLACRFPDKKGLVVSIHGMGGNVGDALAPMAAGALLTFMTWRQVVVVNVLRCLARKPLAPPLAPLFRDDCRSLWFDRHILFSGGHDCIGQYVCAVHTKADASLNQARPRAMARGLPFYFLPIPCAKAAMI